MESADTSFQMGEKFLIETTSSIVMLTIPKWDWGVFLYQVPKREWLPARGPRLVDW